MTKSIKLIKLIVLHSIYWSSVQLIIANVGTYIPRHFFVKHHNWFSSFKFEQQGKFWQGRFKVHLWKKMIPEGQKINSKIYNKKHLTAYDSNTIETMIIETERAELIHWLSILPVVIFVYAPKYLKIINVLYVLIVNIPIIVVQRYNRPRLRRLLRLRTLRGD
ncbi:glycosyl-4,4'-diaponeurosporenoate acyltransferase [Staphylococcus simiae]|uniref:glycosyl-4,4'-diaponeurosporenoate acyltransferase CrtO family protein n=1 Tax=Staphylococcus simiae TaxID=308354 RepID=UPI001A9619B1|nr:glycosyl-4,4'-diaponeurosporenoate acyltransferase [Staphylococcus simiae]MBO1198185.1 glycosyl-4,4'-diaponeurosporenoate acyltransferase [Staphylococcus simiae]MBO1200271.1 glycosyl-4,4'-diaponeurosporenoate acyltransferase [Staphylococcus simiae]MBO1202565.1 glycosyl-4,4'-diaponeurosporenoate acyltransferase [Staphylococcus simiae]MBO1210157.1 glycosyl-4,4'-diaponeurosporenoate acyltransferase [Staphylococcus simiae]MBO1228709.1 glycosyl-4,4'-diaponeurosporenoate acyltransferase [Staphylo